MHKVFLKITVLAALCGFPVLSCAQPPETVRIERLAGLAKLWGAVKYFHPYVAERDIDWDAALVQTISKVESANSTEDYRQAIDNMLSFLHDPNTHTVKEFPSRKIGVAAAAEHPKPYIKWVDEQTALIVATDYAHFLGSFGKGDDLVKVFEEASKAKTIIPDVRNQSGDEGMTFWYSMAFRRAILVLLDQDVIATSSRTRMYFGYPTQGGGYDDYSATFVTRDGQTIHGSAPKGQSHRFVFIRNAGSGNFQDILGGLQSAGLATIVEEGEAGQELGVGSFPCSLPENITVTIGTSEVVNWDGSVGSHPDVAVPESADFSGDGNQAIQAALRAAKEGPSASASKPRQAAAMVVNKLENRYPDMKYPSREYRLLSLFRLWNVMLYFHPYRSLYDHPWEETLTEFIPQFEADRNETEYAITTAKLVARIDDSHGGAYGSVLDDYLGRGRPPVALRSIEGETIVTRIDDENLRASSGLAIGDVILAVDGEEIAARRQRLGELFAASTPQGLRKKVEAFVLAGPKDKPATLKIRNGAGQIKEISVVRTLGARSTRPPKKETPVFQVLPEGLGYIDLTLLEPRQVDEAFEAIKNTPGLIFDMRGYPNGVFAILGARFAEKTVAAALFDAPAPKSPDPTDDSRLAFTQYAKPDSNWKYHGKVVVLINEDAISQSEHTCLFLEATAHAKFIGSPTIGANGDVTVTVLPGDITVSFTGQGVRHADGRQLQRVGIQPDIRVDQTIKGVREGRDEILQRAIVYLKTGQ
jgi:C-terminal processing protease CtpA/Prc